MSNTRTRTAGKGLVTFFLLAYLLTWGFSALATTTSQIPAAIKGLGSLMLHYGPALAGVIAAGLFDGRAGIRRLFEGLARWRVGVRWYLVVLLLPVVLHLVAVGLDVLLGGAYPEFFSAKGVPQGNPLVLLVPVFLAIFFQAGLAEEIGWRGYALPSLQTRFGALVSSLILGALWGPWHFIQTLRDPQAFAPFVLWYLASVIAFTILLTWVYNNTGGSLLLAVLFHTVSNVSDWIVPTFAIVTAASGTRPFIIQVGLTWIVAIVVIVIFGPRHLVRNAD